MSTGTNQERIQQNNAKLTALKTKTDTLPEYQDMQPIYGVSDTQYKNTNITYEGYFSYCKEYFSYRNGNTAYISRFNDDETTSIIFTTTISDLKQFNIIDVIDDYIYIYYMTDYANFHARRLNIKEPTELEVYFDTTVSSYYGIHLVPNDNYYFVSNIYLYKINLDEKKLDIIATANGSNVYGCYFHSMNLALNPKFYTYKGGNYDRCYVYDRDKNLLKAIYEYVDITFANRDRTKIIKNKNLYKLNSDLTFGPLIKSNIVNNTNPFYYIGGDYYINNNVLYTFDEETNTFTKEDNLPSVNYASCFYFVSGNNKRAIITLVPNESEIIGYTIKGNTVYLDGDIYINGDDILEGKEYKSKNNVNVIGKMKNNGALAYTPTTSQQSIPAGYTSGGTISAVTASVDSDIQAENIKSGVNILGVTGNYEGDYSDTLTPEEYEIAVETAEEILDGQVTPVLPYTELEYIESTGTQYIDTGVIPIQSTNFEGYIKFGGQWRSTVDGVTSIKYFLGTRDDINNTNFNVNFGNSDHQYNEVFLWFNRNYATEGTAHSMPEISYDTKSLLKFKNNMFYYGSKSEPTHTREDIPTNISILLCAINKNTSDGVIVNVFNFYEAMFVYSFKIYNGEQLIRDLIPVKRTSDNEICMFDKVTNQFFTNAGTGTFIAGPEVN